MNTPDSLKEFAKQYEAPADADLEAAFRANVEALEDNEDTALLIALVQPMPVEARQAVFDAIKAGCEIKSLAAGLKELTEEGNAAKMARYIESLKVGTEAQVRKNARKPGPKFTPAKKKRRK